MTKISCAAPNQTTKRMGIQAQNSSDRLRTIWTPEMDRYFIDLMLDQVGKGSRIDDHLFSKRAWKHMTSLFNAKFNFQYEKDILKNRHKTLRNLCKAVKNLLDHEGFSWDGTRQMVTAENRVWDDYIKVHPDARSYRIKTIPYFSDLCIIYRNSLTAGKVNNSSHDAALVDGMPGLETGDDDEHPVENVLGTFQVSTMNQTLPDSHEASIVDEAAEVLPEIMIDEDYSISVTKEIVTDTPETIEEDNSISVTKELIDTPEAVKVIASPATRTRTYWQPPMDRYFIDLMLEQVQKGNQIDGLFCKQAWVEMIALFNVKFGFNYDVDILKNRYKTLRKQYNVIRGLLELNGFVWDGTRQMVTADDFVWQDYLKAHTDARQYMTRPVPYYKDLCVICQDLSDVGRESHSGQNVDQPHDHKHSQSSSASISREDDLQEPSDVNIPNKNKHHLQNPSDALQSKKARSADEGMATALREMATAVSSLTDTKKDGDNLNSVSIESVIEAVQVLPEMDEDLVLDACDLLEDEKKAKIFLALDVKLRKKWLIRKLRPQQS